MVYLVDCYSFAIKMDYSKLKFLLNSITRSSHLIKKAACVYLMRKNLGYKDELQVFLYKRVATMIELIESNESLMSLISLIPTFFTFAMDISQITYEHLAIPVYNIICIICIISHYPF